MGWLSLLLAPIQLVISSISDYVKNKNDLDKIKAETDKQVELAKQQLAGEIAKAELEKSKTIVKATGQWFKYFTFFMWFGPFMVGTVRPDIASDIFLNWQGMPDWYVQSCMLIMFTVWGISVSAPVVSNVFNGLGAYMAGRRDYKLQKLALSTGDKEAIYDALRRSRGQVLQSDVDALEPVLDSLNKE